MPSISVPVYSFAALFARAFHSLSCMNSQSLSRWRQLILSILGKRLFLNFLFMKRFPRLSMRQEKPFGFVPRVLDLDQKAAIEGKSDFKYKNCMLCCNFFIVSSHVCCISYSFVIHYPAVPVNLKAQSKNSFIQSSVIKSSFSKFLKLRCTGI